jgi:hypothetical protein
MYLFELISSLLLVFILSSASLSQITVTSGSLPGPGFQYSIGTNIGASGFDVGSSGANQTWTFGQFDWDATATHTIMNPGDAPHHAEFPTATRVDLGLASGDESGTYTFERVTSNALFILGMVSNDTAVQPYTEEMTMVPFPCSYQSSWTSVAHTITEMMGMTMTMVDSTISSVDAYGTMNTPYGSYNVLRSFEHHWMTTQFNDLPPSTDEYYGYVWFNQQGNPVVNAIGDTDPNFTEGMLSMIDVVPVTADPVRGPVASTFFLDQNYPNPFNPTTTLPLTVGKSGQVTVEIYNENGRLQSSETFELPAGHHELPINGSSWASGTYFARVATGSQSQTTKMTLLK